MKKKQPYPKNAQVDEQELYRQADMFMQSHFHQPLQLPIVVNPRLSASLGRLVCMPLHVPKNAVNNQIWSEHYTDVEMLIKDLSWSDYTEVHYPLRIELNKNHLIHSTPESIMDTLYHECIHYGLCVQRKPFSDSSKEFVETCHALGVSLSGEKSVTLETSHWVCPTCGKSYYTLRKHRHIYCRKDLSPLDYVDQQVREQGGWQGD